MVYDKKKAATALAKPATGQFTPGALSSAKSGTYASSPASTPTSNPYPYVTIEGKSGQLVPAQTRPQTDINQMTPAFAAKLAEAQKQAAQPVAAQQMMAGLDFQNTTNPLAPNYVGGKAPSPFENMGSQVLNPKATLAGSEGGAQKTSVFGAKIDEMATKVLNAGFDIIQSLGGGDFGRGLAAFLTVPITASTGAVSKGAKVMMRNSPGVVTKGSLANGGVTASQMIMQALTKNIRPSGALSTIKPILVVGGVLWFVNDIIKNSTGTGSIGTRDVHEEGGGAVITACRDFFKAGDMQGYTECKQLWKDTKNTQASWVPYGIGATKNVNAYVDIVDKVFEMYDAHAERMQQMAGSGVTPESTANFWSLYHEQVNAAQTAAEKERVDYFNSEKLRVDKEILAAKTSSYSAERSASSQQARELAAFWLEYKRKIIEMEKAQQEANAKFWLDYRKMIMKIQEESRGSKLGFGLLR